MGTRQEQMIEEANYRNDPRVRGADSDWWSSFNAATMVATFETTTYDEETEVVLDVQMVYIVCDVCRGKGTHVNPSIDASGISFEEYDDYDDGDFRERYNAGAFDVTCYTCKGLRVVPAMADSNSPEVVKAIDDYLNGLADDWAEAEAERRMGC